MKIILLLGDAQCGKTPTLKMVHSTLVNTYGALSGPVIPHPNDNDMEVVLSYKGKTVAISTAGDNEWADCVSAIIKHTDKDVLILTSRKFAYLPGIIQNYPHLHHVLPKTLASPPNITELAANTADCNTIIGLI